MRAQDGIAAVGRRPAIGLLGNRRLGHDRAVAPDRMLVDTAGDRAGGDAGREFAEGALGTLGPHLLLRGSRR